MDKALRRGGSQSILRMLKTGLRPFDEVSTDLELTRSVK